jgi:hypothetical protein
MVRRGLTPARQADAPHADPFAKGTPLSVRMRSAWRPPSRPGIDAAAATAPRDLAAEVCGLSNSGCPPQLNGNRVRLTDSGSRTHMKRLLLLLILLALPTTALPSQQQNSAFSVGGRVRLETCEVSPLWRGALVRRHIGIVFEVDSQRLILQATPSRRDTVSTSEIATAWHSLGRRSRLATGLRGLLLGAAAGTLIGVGLDAMNHNQSGDGSGEAFESILLPAVGGVLGGGIGALVGVASGGEQWQRIPVSAETAHHCVGQ